eukprot:2425276-Amphidinium_carterae.1
MEQPLILQLFEQRNHSQLTSYFSDAMDNPMFGRFLAYVLALRLWQASTHAQDRRVHTMLSMLIIATDSSCNFELRRRMPKEKERHVLQSVRIIGSWGKLGES